MEHVEHPKSNADEIPQFARSFGADALDELFPTDGRALRLARMIEAGQSAFEPVGARFGRPQERDPQEELHRWGSLMPHAPAGDAHDVVSGIASGFLSGAVNWRDSSLHYNLGAPPTTVSTALYALGLDANVYLINDGLAGRAILAEAAVSRILSELAGVAANEARGLFVFGGTGTIAYSIRCGLAKSTPDLAQDGIDKRSFVAITEEAHFSHARSSRWLGLGDSQILVLPANEDRTTDVDGAIALIDERVAQGGRLATLLVNGGTTYDHGVDDVPRFRGYLEELAAREGWDYRPHLHVDSVIGWEWLFFRGHDFDSTSAFDSRTRVLLREQAELVESALGNADSWGVDFHKGAGCCPIDCSMVMFNDGRDLGYLNGHGRLDEMHQLASELSVASPADHTLETSRAGAKALAALGTLHSLGRDGYQAVLGGLVEAAQRFRAVVAEYPDMQIENTYSRGYQSMVRIFPPELSQSSFRETERKGTGDEQRAFTEAVNAYHRAFVEWDERVRMSRQGPGPYYSFSGRFRVVESGAGLTGLKFYPTSPRLSNAEAEDAARVLADLKAEFDAVDR